MQLDIGLGRARVYNGVQMITHPEPDFEAKPQYMVIQEKPVYIDNRGDLRRRRGVPTNACSYLIDITLYFEDGYRGFSWSAPGSNGKTNRSRPDQNVNSW